MTIDEGKLFTPWRNLQMGKRFTDDNAIIFELQCGRSKGNDKINRKVVWNFNYDKGWEKFLDLTGNDSSLLILRYGRVAVMFRSVTKIGKVG